MDAIQTESEKQLIPQSMYLSSDHMHNHYCSTNNINNNNTNNFENLNDKDASSGYKLGKIKAKDLKKK